MTASPAGGRASYHATVATHACHVPKLGALSTSRLWETGSLWARMILIICKNCNTRSVSAVKVQL